MHRIELFDITIEMCSAVCVSVSTSFSMVFFFFFVDVCSDFFAKFDRTRMQFVIREIWNIRYVLEYSHIERNQNKTRKKNKSQSLQASEGKIVYLHFDCLRIVFFFFRFCCFNSVENEQYSCYTLILFYVSSLFFCFRVHKIALKCANRANIASTQQYIMISNKWATFCWICFLYPHTTQKSATKYPFNDFRCFFFLRIYKMS